MSFREPSLILQSLEKEFPDIPVDELREAVNVAWQELDNVRKDMARKGEEVLTYL